MPHRRATARAWRTVLNALNFFMSSVTSIAPCLIFFEWIGNRISLDLYSFNRCAFSWRDSTDLFLLRGSTEMPMVWAIFLLTPADLSSSRVKPRPRRCLTLYLSVGHRITGRRVLTGLGATCFAFSTRAALLRIFLAGWLNQHLT